MKTYYIITAISLIFLIIGGIVGWHVKPTPETGHPVQVMVPARINIDSIKNITSRGKIDSVKYEQLLGENKELAEKIAELLSQSPETVKVSEAIPRARFDSTVCVTVEAEVIQGSDTMRSTQQTEIGTDLYYYPQYNLFELRKLQVSPFKIWLAKKDSIVYVKEPTVFGMQVLGGWMGTNTPGAGGMVRLDWLSVGGMAMYKHPPLWLIGVRIGREM
jgi:hypothetical protein